MRLPSNLTYSAPSSTVDSAHWRFIFGWKEPCLHLTNFIANGVKAAEHSAQPASFIGCKDCLPLAFASAVPEASNLTG